MLRESIFKTLAFFDAQDMALTLVELRDYLVAPSPGEVGVPQKARSGFRGIPEGREAEGGERSQLSEIEKVITIDLKAKVHCRKGFYFLAGREHLVSLRQQRYQVSLPRFEKCKKYLRPLRLMPYVRAVALSGSQALLASDEDSDIDLFIIVKKNRIWLVRALVSLYFQILGQRRYGQNINNRFCLNHYVSEDWEITWDRNLYTAVEYASLLPVVGREELKKFWRKNFWIREYLAEPILEEQNKFFQVEPSLFQKSLEWVLDLAIAPVLNYILGIYQKQRIKPGDHILVSDDELSFHPGSRGQNVLLNFRKKSEMS